MRLLLARCLQREQKARLHSVQSRFLAKRASSNTRHCCPQPKLAFAKRVNISQSVKHPCSLAARYAPVNSATKSKAARPPSLTLQGRYTLSASRQKQTKHTLKRSYRRSVSKSNPTGAPYLLDLPPTSPLRFQSWRKAQQQHIPGGRCKN